MSKPKSHKEEFSIIEQLINDRKRNIYRAINSELIDLYWEIGAFIQKKIELSEWGKYVVKELADYLKNHDPELKGFSSQNLWRMRQFYNTYKDNIKLSPLVRELTWTNNLIILSKTDSNEEKEYSLSRSLSPTMISKYQTSLLNKSVLERKLEEFYKLEEPRILYQKMK